MVKFSGVAALKRCIMLVALSAGAGCARLSDGAATPKHRARAGRVRRTGRIMSDSSGVHETRPLSELESRFQRRVGAYLISAKITMKFTFVFFIAR